LRTQKQPAKGLKGNAMAKGMRMPMGIPNLLLTPQNTFFVTIPKLFQFSILPNDGAP
jgi:hypothetical protein